eukprot:4013201-Amphidinium_carterae.1
MSADGYGIGCRCKRELGPLLIPRLFCSHCDLWFGQSVKCYFSSFRTGHDNHYESDGEPSAPSQPRKRPAGISKLIAERAAGSAGAAGAP